MYCLLHSSNILYTLHVHIDFLTCRQVAHPSAPVETMLEMEKFKPTHAARFTGLYMGVEPKIGVGHPNHPLKNWVFPYFHHPFWGSPIFGLTPTFLYACSLYSLLHLDCSIPRLSRVPGRTAQAMAAETACVILEGSLTKIRSGEDPPNQCRMQDPSPWNT